MDNFFFKIDMRMLFTYLYKGFIHPLFPKINKYAIISIIDNNSFQNNKNS